MVAVRRSLPIHNRRNLAFPYNGRSQKCHIRHKLGHDLPIKSSGLSDWSKLKAVIQRPFGDRQASILRARAVEKTGRICCSIQ